MFISDVFFVVLGDFIIIPCNDDMFLHGGSLRKCMC